jgi:hypothetical protein
MKKVKPFLAIIFFALIVCIPLNAQVNSEEVFAIADQSSLTPGNETAATENVEPLQYENIKNEQVIFCENAAISGKEYIFIKKTKKDKGDLPVENIQTDTSSYIFISENALIYGKEHLFAKQEATLSNPRKNIAGMDNKECPPAENHITEKEPSTTLWALPLLPSSSSSYIQCDGALAVIILQQRLSEQLSTGRINGKNTYSGVENADLPRYSAEQRQKFSPIAVQCGLLISFGSNSPSLS